MLRDLEEGGREDDAGEAQAWVPQEVRVDDQTAHGIAIKEAGKMFLELLEHACHIVVHPLDVRTRAPGS